LNNCISIIKNKKLNTMTNQVTINGKIKVIKDYEVINLGSRKNPEMIVFSVKDDKGKVYLTSKHKVEFITNY